MVRVAEPAGGASEWRMLAEGGRVQDTTAGGATEQALRTLALAFSLHQQNRLAEAAPLYEQVLLSDPDQFDALHMRGVIATQTGDLTRARAWLERALALQPRSLMALGNYCVLLFAQGDSLGALECAEIILKIDPDNAVAYNDRGRALTNLSRLDEALASFEAALARDPRYLEAHYNRATIYLQTGRFEEAIDGFGQALSINSGMTLARCAQAQCRWQFNDWHNYAADRQTILEAVRSGQPVSTPVFFLALSDSAADQLACNRAHLRSMVKVAPAAPWAGNPYRHERIRLAYVSADFKEHAVSYLTAGLFEAHRRDHFEVIGVEIGPSVIDPMQQRIEHAFDRYIRVGELSDRNAADQLRALEIDIAVDLTGATRNGRPGLFALRPAPVQISYLGFPGTSGAEWIDYIIADRVVIPEAVAQHYSEKILWLPVSFQVSDDKRPRVPEPMTRRQCGLPDDGLVLASFNGNAKITPELFDLWMRLLRAIDSSVLWLFAPHPRSQENLLQEAYARGVTRDRIVFAESLPYQRHLARISLADILLDTFPFNGGTTVNDALWAGLPVVTRAGEAFAARMAAGLLMALGLPELIAQDFEEYESIVLTLARNPTLRAQIQARLARRHESTLFSTEALCDVLESGYKCLYAASQAGAAPRSLLLDARPDGRATAESRIHGAPAARRSGWLSRWLGS